MQQTLRNVFLNPQNLKSRSVSLGWKLWDHAQRQWIAWIFVALSVILFAKNYTIGYNLSPSLPYTLFLVHKGEAFEKRDLAAFRWHGGIGKYHGKTPYREGMTFVKRVAGWPGDQLSINENREIVLNNFHVLGKAKELSLKREPLEVLQLPKDGVIPPGYYYMAAPHPDSLDSRYEMTGLIPHSAFIGKAYVIF
jgi:conjugal transfer pilin signal peptidase TrbI